MRAFSSRSISVGLMVLVIGCGGGVIAWASVGHHARRSAARYSVSISSGYDPGGNPSLVANFSPDGSLAKPRWWICPAGNPRGCVWTGGHGQFLTPGRTAAGTVFEARVSYRGVSYVTRTAVWQGSVHAVARARLEGAARYGAEVVARRASWAGGWRAGHGFNTDSLNVEACRTRAAEDCVNLTAQGQAQPFSDRPAVVGAWWTGSYLFAFDQRGTTDGLYAAVGYLFPADIPPETPGATVVGSRPVGPVIGPPRPHVKILRHTREQSGHIPVAELNCATRCRVSTSVLSRTTWGSGRRTSVLGHGSVEVPRGRLAAGPHKVTLHVGDGPAVTGTTHLR
jgi:hypothetical protein